MTEQEKQQLSRDVAEKLLIDEYYGKSIDSAWYKPDPSTVTWLHEDSARCFDLIVEHGIDIEPNNNGASSAYVKGKKHRTFVDILHSDHSTKQEATRIAILKALLAKG